jgi:ABC-type phosphate/phosphonate transport system substrate-binding protein
MYPFEPLRMRWEQLWSAVHVLAPWTPAPLRWTGDVHEHWVDPSCQVAQACGWPVATALRGRVDVVGAFSLALPDADGHRYRSVLVSNRPAAFDELVTSTTVAAVNARDSLSGWVSLLAAAGLEERWIGPVRWTGSHTASLRAVRDGDADVTSIDALTLALVRRHDRDLTDGLHEVGRGPWVPSLPVVVRAGTAKGHVAALRHALVDVLGRRDFANLRRDLLLDGFVALGSAVYRPLLELLPHANVGTFVPAIPEDRDQR